MNNTLNVSIDGHVKIVDDLGETILDKHNSVHPQNMARIISRAFSREDNYYLYRLALGNGGTFEDAAYNISFRTPNNGQTPDVRTWDSRLYSEIYSEIIDDRNTLLIGTDPGSAGPNAGNRIGGGHYISSEPPSVEHVSGPGVRSSELGLQSEVEITLVLNPDEPTGFDDNEFTFDELGLYTSGAQAVDTNGSFSLDVGSKTSADFTGLLPDTAYSFIISVDGSTERGIEFVTPSEGSGPTQEILYGDLCEAINTGNTAWNTSWGGSSQIPNNGLISITDTSGSFPTISGSQTFGQLLFTSSSTGSTSNVVVLPGGTTELTGTDLFAGLGVTNLPEEGTIGNDAGLQNNPTASETERERLLTHLIFSPITKAPDRTYTVTYTLTIFVS